MKVFAAPVKGNFGPEKFPLEELERIRRDIGGATWASLYQQRPAAAEGTVFKRGWWGWSDRELPACKRIVQSWDTAFKAGSQSDYSVCSTWGVLEKGYYLLSLWRGRVDFPELKRLGRFAGERMEPQCNPRRGRGQRSESDSGAAARKFATHHRGKDRSRQDFKGTVDNAVDRSREGFSSRNPHPGLLTL